MEAARTPPPILHQSPAAQSASPVAQGAVRAALRPFLHLSSRPEQAAFSCARFVCAACAVEGPWQHHNPTNVTETQPPIKPTFFLKLASYVNLWYPIPVKNHASPQARLPQKIPKTQKSFSWRSHVHQSLQRSCLFVFIH